MQHTYWYGAVPVLGIALVLCGTVIAAPSDRYFHAEGPPPAHTGGFQEPTCMECHDEFDLNPGIGALGIDGLPAAYKPGEAYDVSIVVQGDAEMARAGFQGAFRFADGPHRSTRAGVAEALDDRVAIRVDEMSGAEYVQHSIAGTGLTASQLATWIFRWTAPQSADPIVFHVAANSANGDNSPLGDLIYFVETSMLGDSSANE